MQHLLHTITFKEKFDLAMLARGATPLKQRKGMCFVLKGRIWHLGADGTLHIGKRNASIATRDAIIAEADATLAMLYNMMEG